MIFHTHSVCTFPAVKPCSILSRVTEEYDLVANPIYNISMQRTASIPQQQMANTYTVTTVPREDTAVTYEEVTNLHGNKPIVQVQ